MSLISLHSEQSSGAAPAAHQFLNHFQPGMEILPHSEVALNSLFVTMLNDGADATVGSAVRLMFSDGGDDWVPYNSAGRDDPEYLLNNTQSRGSFIQYLEPRSYSSTGIFEELQLVLNTTAHPSLFGRITVTPTITAGNLVSAMISADQGTTEHNELTGSGQVRNQKIIGELGMTGEVGKNAKRAGHHDRGHDGKTIQPVCKVDGVAATDNDEVAQQDEEHRPEGQGNLLDERHIQGGFLG